MRAWLYLLAVAVAGAIVTTPAIFVFVLLGGSFNDALRDGGEFELAHSSRAEPMIDLMAMAQVDRETEVTYIRKERDWLQRAIEAGRFIESDRLLTVLPATLSRDGDSGNGNGSGGGTHARLK